MRKKGVSKFSHPLSASSETGQGKSAKVMIRWNIYQTNVYGMLEYGIPLKEQNGYGVSNFFFFFFFYAQSTSTVISGRYREDHKGQDLQK